MPLSLIVYPDTLPVSGRVQICSYRFFLQMNVGFYVGSYDPTKFSKNSKIKKNKYSLRVRFGESFKQLSLVLCCHRYFAITDTHAWICVRSPTKSSYRENMLYEVSWFHRNLRGHFFRFLIRRGLDNRVVRRIKNTITPFFFFLAETEAPV